eukprot:Hpha_TRINITY_DN15805_c1_g5::TRINITY_DN15805_c1_g5_i6::g.190225::m.190225/K04421/MAP3K3, MEKK3; mitogen-activated protein kinase kinase kinase 3
MIKGRRARIAQRKNAGGEPTPLTGWVSLRSGKSELIFKPIIQAAPPGATATGAFQRLGFVPKPWDLHVLVDEVQDLGDGEDSYILKVSKNKDTPLWAVSRRHHEIVKAYQALATRAKAGGKKPPPEVDSSGMFNWLAGKQKQQEQRMKAYNDFFTFVLADQTIPILSNCPDFTALIGIKRHPSEWGSSSVEACQAGCFDDRAVLSGDFTASLRRSGTSTGPSNSPTKDMSQSTLEEFKSTIDEKWFTSEGPLAWQRVKMLGKGAFGTVWLGMLQTKGMQVAVKIVGLGDSVSPQEKQTIEAEFRLMQRLHHPNIVQYLGHSFTPGATELHIFTEFLPGGSVASRIKDLKAQKQRLSGPVVRHYTRQTIQGLQFLHTDQRGPGGELVRPAVVHRDIKGDNLLLATSGDVKLADFGCSKLIEPVVGAGVTMAQQDGAVGAATLVGTPFWMAPEVIAPQKHGQYGIKCDIWSLACTVLEMCNHMPWSESIDPSTPWQIMYHIANSESPPGYPEGTRPKLKNFLDSCFQRDPKKRPTAEALLMHSYMTCPDEEL